MNEPTPSRAERTPRLIQPQDLLCEWEADALAAHEAYRTGQPRGPVTSFPKLDRALGGALFPGLHVVHGQPGAGKTAFAVQVAATCGFPALFVSCEMSPLEMWRRIAARVTGTYLGRFKTGELKPDFSMDQLKKAAAATPHFFLADATLAPAPRAWIQEAALAVRSAASQVLVVIDSLHSWTEGMPASNISEYEALNIALFELRELSHALASPVLIVAERNRQSMNTGGISAGAGSRKIEYGAQTVFDMSADQEKATPEGEIPVTITLSKNRNGAPGFKTNMTFHGAKQLFAEV